MPCAVRTYDLRLLDVGSAARPGDDRKLRRIAAAVFSFQFDESVFHAVDNLIGAGGYQKHVGRGVVFP